jgi:hypothetical protein
MGWTVTNPFNGVQEDWMICPECGDPCEIIIDNGSFDYAGTHCTHGMAGTHHEPDRYVSACCEADMGEVVDNAKHAMTEDLRRELWPYDWRSEIDQEYIDWYRREDE